jgi:hypothetical protein
MYIGYEEITLAATEAYASVVHKRLGCLSRLRVELAKWHKDVHRSSNKAQASLFASTIAT